MRTLPLPRRTPYLYLRNRLGRHYISVAPLLKDDLPILYGRADFNVA